ncbi:MAG: gliding motility-associated C-terminal domain-containing protein [Cyclobacteriaceae bacterium]|nr:gliding motility-associated C-terminal domain-containing protein [Cyclobacteriaceae bacterium]
MKKLRLTTVTLLIMLSGLFQTLHASPFLLPKIGLATSAAAPALQADGSYNITYTLTVKNYGDEKLTNVQVTDALGLVFIIPTTYSMVGNVVATGTLIGNPAFNGGLNSNLLAAGSFLNVGVQQTIIFTINVVPNLIFGPFASLPVASANGTILPVLDTSVNGNNPDPNGDGTPLETSATIVNLSPLPVIGVAKSAAAPQKQANGSYSIPFTITIKNLGNEILNNVQVSDNLSSVFIFPSTYTVGSVVSTGSLVANGSYNGNTNSNLLAAGSTLGLGATQTITFNVNVVTNGLFGPFLNTATASANGSILPTLDLSVDGNNPDPNGDGIPLELLPTSISLIPTPIIGIAKSATAPLLQPDGTNNVTFTMTVKNLGNEPLTNVQVTDNLITAFIGPSAYSIVGGVITSGTLTANAGFNGNIATNLLNSSTSTLAIGATQTIVFTVNVDPHGSFGPFANIATASANGSLLPTIDISVDGNNPDPNGDGIPLETSPTIVSLLPIPIIGVAKSASVPVLQPNGSYNIPFTIVIENLGNEVLNNVQVTDNLLSTFASPSIFSIVGHVLTSGSLVSNGAYDGNLFTNLLQPGSTLAVGASQTITFTVNVVPNGLFGLIVNTAIASATGSLLPTLDISVDGNDPDPNGDGLPLELLPTIVTLVPVPIIGIAKSASSPQLQPNGSYNVTFTLTLENLGNEVLSNVQATDVLTSAFIGPSTYSLVGNIIASGSLIANSSFNGFGITNLLAAGSTLAVGATQTVVFTVNVEPHTAFGPFLNTAIASATGSLLPTTDISYDGNDPDPNGDGLPLETLPTIINLVPMPIIGLAKSASAPLAQVDGSYNVTYTFTVKNLGNEPLHNVQVTDNMASVFVGPSVYTIVGNVAASGTLIANAGFNGNLLSNLLAPGSTLNVGETQTITVTVNAVPHAIFGPFVNTAIASAMGSLLPTIDLSMDGNNPDPNGDGIPLETLPTIVVLIPVPVIGIAKSASTPLLQPDGSYNVTYSFVVENLGNETLNNVQVIDPLVTTFPSPTVYNLIGNVVSTGTLIANTLFNGNALQNLLASGSTLNVGASETITFTVNIKPTIFFGPFINSAVATGMGSLLPTIDVSMDGNNPDPNGDGIPLEVLPTIITLTPSPIIGVAKNVISAILQPDGSYNVTYGIILKNYGNVSLHNITLIDNLTQALGLSAGFGLTASVSTTGGLTANIGFNGTLDLNLLDGLNSVLGIGETQTINFTVNVRPGGLFGPYCNTAIVTATGPLGLGLTVDVSTSGTNPDPNGNGNPSEISESNCTSLNLTSNPVIGIAKSASVPVLQSNGSYNVAFLFTVKNLGNTALTNVQVVDDLVAALPAPSTYTISVAPSASGTLAVNSGFNGNSNKNLLAAGSTLATGATATISFTANVLPNGSFGPFFNTALASAKDALTTATTNDISTDGTQPDLNGNNNPGDTDESVPTPFTLTPNALIGIAKAASAPALQANGSYNMMFTFTIQNMGNVALNNVQVTDNLTSVFPSPSAFSVIGSVTTPLSLIANPGFNGSSDINLLSAGSTLAAGATEHITLNINVMPNGSFGPFFNTAVATATASGFAVTSTDVSTDGINPDPNNNNNPSDAGEDVATSISLAPNPTIGVAKSVVSSTLQSNGSYVVALSITVKNHGNVTLNNVQVTDDLTTAFSSPTTFTITQLPSSTGGLSPNLSYNGRTDINLLAAGNSLAPGESQTITFSTNVVVNGNFGPYYNSAKGSATGASGSGNTTDISASGTNPDPNGNGNPSEAGENDATMISLTPNAVMGVAKSAGTPVILSNGTYQVTYTVTVKNLGNAPFTNFQVTDNLNNTFTSPTTYTVSGPVVVSGSATPNAAFNGSTNINLLSGVNTLPIGVTETITFQVIIDPHGSFGPFNNSAVGTATSPSGNYSDVSANGTNPDPNGNGNPGDAGEDDATSITLTPQPVLGVAKAASTPIVQANGSYHITYTVSLKNMGNVTLNNIQLTDDLNNAFPLPATFILIGTNVSGLLVANPSYNGVSDINLITSGSIAVGATQTVTYTVEVQANGSFGPFLNSAIGKGTNGAVTYTDISNSGTNPDPNGNGNPGDAGEDIATSVTFSPNMIAGVAKAASLPIAQADGTYKIVYTLQVENLGNYAINNIQVKDFLSNAYPAPVTFTVAPGSATTGTLIINPSYNGSTDVNLLAPGSKLAIGANFSITYTVLVNLNGTSGMFYNRATVTSISDDTLTTYTDISSNGTDPDPNGNGNPSDAGENDPTGVNLTPHAVLGVAKAVSVPLQQTDGSFDVTYSVTVENLGNIILNQVQVTDNLAQAFPAPATFTVDHVNTLSTLTVNPAFNGKTDKNLFAAGNSLSVGASAVVNFTVHIQANGSAGIFYNSATGSANANNGALTTTDLSVIGNNPDPNGNGNPGDVGEDSATPVTLILTPVVGIAKSASVPLLNMNGSYDVTFTIVVENLGNTALSNIAVYDDIALVLPVATPFTLKSTIATTGSLVANPSFNGSTIVNLLVGTSTLAIGGKETIKFTVNIPGPISAGPYYNTALAFASNSDNSLTYGDISTQGSDPDPNGNGNPNDTNESQPTPFLLQLAPVLGIANNASTPVLKADGSYDINFTITVQNMGNEDLTSIDLLNDLADAFPAPAVVTITSAPQIIGSLVLNPSYNGKTNTDMISSGKLEVGDTQWISFSINVKANNSFGLFLSSVDGMATGMTTLQTTMDISDMGMVCDEDGDGNPCGANENEATRITLIANELIGISKTVSTPIALTSCDFEVTYTMNIENFGNSTLTMLDVTDSLRKVFPLPATFSVTNVMSPTLHVNANFNGITDSHLLTGTDNFVPQQKATVSFTIILSPNGNYGSFLNLARATGTGPGNNKVTDVSTDGTSADPDLNHDPSENVPTSLTLAPANLFFPDAFSPNGDGQHDNYEITLSCGVSASLLIFNRWGDKVYSSADYKNDWNGTSSHGSFLDRPLPEGTYYYNIELSSGQKFTSFVVIKR